MAEVTILGMGRMGAAMAAKLAEAGHTLTVWNRTASVAQEVAVRIGATAAPSAVDAVRGASVVVSILADGPSTEAVLLDQEVLGAMAPGTVVLDMATSGPDTARTLAAGLAAAGVRFVDAPVSGSVPTIAAGQLLVMASGDEAAVQEVEPVLASMAKQVVYLGPAGAGQAMKLSVNLVVHTLNAAVSEGLALASAAGVPLESAYDVFQASVVAAPFVTYKRPAFLDPATPVAMSLQLTRKDLDLITGFADEAGVGTEVADAVLTEVDAACAAGFADQDMAALSRYLRGLPHH